MKRKVCVGDEVCRGQRKRRAAQTTWLLSGLDTEWGDQEKSCSMLCIPRSASSGGCHLMSTGRKLQRCAHVSQASTHCYMFETCTAWISPLQFTSDVLAADQSRLAQPTTAHLPLQAARHMSRIPCQSSFFQPVFDGASETTCATWGPHSTGPELLPPACTPCSAEWCTARRPPPRRRVGTWAGWWARLVKIDIHCRRSHLPCLRTRPSVCPQTSATALPGALSADVHTGETRKLIIAVETVR